MSTCEASSDSILQDCTSASVTGNDVALHFGFWYVCVGAGGSTSLGDHHAEKDRIVPEGDVCDHLCFHSVSSRLPSFLLSLRFMFSAGTM